MQDFPIKGLHCQSCVTSIEHILNESGYEGITIDLEKEILSVPDKQTGLEKIKELVETVGNYELIIK